MATHGWLSLALLAWVLGAFVGWLAGTRRWGLILSHLLAAAGALATGVVGVRALFAQQASLGGLPEPVVYRLPLVGPFGVYELRVDQLSGLFLLVLGLVGTAAALYGAGYTAAWLGRRRARTLAALFNVFLLAMTAVLTAADAYTFLLAWEAMSVSSFFLVVTEFEHKAVRQTGLLYLVMTHLATALIVLACLVWYVHEPEAARSLGFGALAGVAPHLAPWLRSLLFLLLLAGFGTKAGAVPLHIWLPRAHPVAPSHVSALMSGVMVKVGLYGIIRFALDLLGPGPVWWGGVLLGVGVLSALVGVVYANQESDLKRLLAYSTVENVGLMLMGLGVAAIGLSADGQGMFAAYALLAVFFHVLAHGAYKGLLFLAAGAVLHGAGERSLEKLGGLIRRLPTTSLFFFVGALAIAGLPPLAGFVSEWLLMGALAGATAQTFAPWLQVVAPLLIAVVGMVAALVAATMVKAFGVGFLGMPRTAAAAHAHEANKPMLAGMGLLAVTVVGLGLFPRIALRLISVAGVALCGPLMSGHSMSPAAPVSPLQEVSSRFLSDGFFAGALRTGLVTPTARYEALWVAGALAVGVGLGVLLTALLGRRGPVRRSPVWASGVPFAPVNQYTAGSFAKPLRLMLRTVLRPQREVQVVEGTPLFPRRLRYQGTIRLWLDSSYRHAVRQVVRVSRRVRALQMGNLQAYLAYMFVALVLLLLLAR